LLQKVMEGLLRLALRWRSRPNLVRRYLASQRIKASGNLRRVDPRRVRVAAVQMLIELSGNAEDYARRVLDLARRAAGEGAQLVVFPEDSATHLVGFLPGMKELAARGDVSQALQAMGGNLRPADIFAFLGETTRRVYLETFSGVARALGIYVVAGSALLPEGGRVYNVAHLFGPDGALLGTQRKAHLIPLEKEWGLQAGEDLRVFSTPLGNLAMPVCMDATYYETFRILAGRGADMVALPTADPDDFNPWKKRRGLWPRVQESSVYGIMSCLVGELFGLKLTGRSAIFIPVALSPNGDGVLAELQDPHREGVVTADLDLLALREYRLSNPLAGAFNLALYERYLPRLYREAPADKAPAEPSSCEPFTWRE